MVSHGLDSILENLVRTGDEIFLADSWEALAVGQALSVSVLLTIFGHMISMSVWYHDFLEAALFARHHGGVSILHASVEAEVIASVNHLSETDV